jgi:hypothetical protein
MFGKVTALDNYRMVTRTTLFVTVRTCSRSYHSGM